MSDKNPHLMTREAMHATIDRKEGILLPNGRIVTRKEHLPGEAEIALMTNDATRMDAAKDDLQKQINVLHQQLGALKEGKMPGSVLDASPPTEATTDDKAAERAALLSGQVPADTPRAEVPPAPAAGPAKVEAAADTAKPKSK